VEVADLMWPDAEGDRAEHALEITLHRLRALLGDAALVKRQDGLLTLDRAHIFADVWAAEDLARHGQVARLDGEFLPANSSDWAVRTRARLAALIQTKV